MSDLQQIAPEQELSEDENEKSSIVIGTCAPGYRDGLGPDTLESEPVRSESYKPNTCYTESLEHAARSESESCGHAAIQ